MRFEGQAEGALTRVGAVDLAVLPGALSAAQIAALSQGLDRAEADPAVAALALIGLGLGAPEAAGAEALATRLRAFSKPVVLGVTGHCTGAWGALALAADWLICDATSRFSFADVQLGLVPGGGVTQALPRRIGVQETLRLLLSATPVAAAEALALGLVDQVVEGDLAAAVLAQALAGRQRPHQAWRDPLASQTALEAARAACAASPLPAPRRIVDCVEAALLLPLPQGLGYEAAAREELAAGEVAAGLGHLRQAEQAVAAALPEAAWPPPEALSVWGDGGRADVLVRRALRAGLRVALCVAERAALIAVLERIAAAQESDVIDGRLTAAERDADWARLTPWLDAVADGPVLICPGAEAWVASLAAGHVALSAGADTPEDMPKLSFFSVLRAELSLGSEAVMAVVDLLGLQVLPVAPGAAVSQTLRAALAAAVAAQEAQGTDRSLIAQALAGAGLLAGPARNARPSPKEAAVLARCIGAVIVAGARLLAEGRVTGAAVLDLIAVASGLFPRWSGGPMFQADRRGLLLWRRDLALWAQDDPQIWTPPPLLEQLLAEGRSFKDFAAISG